jgi:hypothetical protein
MDAAMLKKGWGMRGVFIVFALLAVLGGVGYFACSWNYFYHNAPERVGKDMAYMWQWKMYAGGMRAVYAKDTYGGDTPEATLQLFIDALKAGNIDLAAKYYIPEKQSEVYGELSKSQEKQTLVKYIDYLQKGDHGVSSSVDEYHILASNENKEIILDIQLALNPLTKKWKIAAP